MLIRQSLFALAALFLSACVTETKIIKADLTKRQGTYVVAFIADLDLRATVENQIVQDLAAQNIKARASNQDINNILLSSREDVLLEANQHDLLGVLVINQVAADASDSIVADPQRVSPTHPNLRAFYAHANENAPQPTGDTQRVFAEMNLFILDEDQANLFWSGTVWTMGDGRGSAVVEISDLVAQQLANARQRLLAD